MSGRWRVLVLGMAVLALVSALWWRPDGGASEPTVQTVAATLRCPTCAGESAADSAAPAARGMRAVIADRLAAGEDPEEIRAFFVDRYGEWILLDPPRRGVGWALVVLPGVALAIGVIAVWVLVAHRRPHAEAVLSAADRRRAEAVVASAGGPGPAIRDGLDERLEAALQLLGDLRADPGVSRRAEDELLAEILRRSAVPGKEAAPAHDAPPAEGPAASNGPPGRRLRSLVALVVSGAVVGGGLLAAARFQETPAAEVADAGAPAGTASSPVDTLLAQARALDDAGRFGEAATAYRAVLEERPDDLPVSLALAFALIRADRPQDAVPLMETVLDARPDHPEALLVLGTAERALGRDSAEGTLRRFLELAPEHPAAAAVRALPEQP